MSLIYMQKLLKLNGPIKIECEKRKKSGVGSQKERHGKHVKVK